jgi:hypothetical protein
LASDTDALQMDLHLARSHSREFAGRRKAAQQRRTPNIRLSRRSLVRRRMLSLLSAWLRFFSALCYFSKPIFFSSATKRGCERTASQLGSVFNSGNQGVCSSTARSSQSRAKSELCPCNPWSIPLRRQRSDDFFEARIATERIPRRVKAEFAVRRAGRNFGESPQLLNRQIALASLCADHSIKIK